jgi:hypothetical protein
MDVVAGSAGIVARYLDGRWEDAQPSVLSFLGGDTDELGDQWCRAGTARGGVAHRRPSRPHTHAERPWPTPCASDEKGSNRIGQRRRQLSEAILKYPVWPTPTTQDAKNDGAPSQQERNMKPLNALVVTHPEGDEAEHAAPKTPLLNAVFVELLMGFSEGWTHV